MKYINRVWYMCISQIYHPKSRLEERTRLAQASFMAKDNVQRQYKGTQYACRKREVNFLAVTFTLIIYVYPKLTRFPGILQRCMNGYRGESKKFERGILVSENYS